MGCTAKIGLIVVQLTGLILSALLLFVTFANPNQVEERLQTFAIAEVENAAEIAWSATSRELAEGNRAERLGALAAQFGLQADAVDIKRQQIVPGLLAQAQSENCIEKCDYWAMAAVVANSEMVARVGQLRIGQATLQEFIRDRYDTSVQGLLTDLRRFALVNVIALSLMLGLVVLRNNLNWRFMAFSGAVTGYTVWATYGYVFGQDWALTILFQDWAAPGYQAAMLFASFLFFDWLFLRRVVTEFSLNVVGSMLSGLARCIPG